ncbi:MAG: hypothetical protein R2865_01230 [Deinococcales bacterium]
MNSGDWQMCATWQIDSFRRSLTYSAQGDGMSMTWQLAGNGVEGGIVARACAPQGCHQAEATFRVAPVMTASR